MKRNIIMTLFAVLATMAVSCQKEEVADYLPTTSISEN